VTVITLLAAAVLVAVHLLADKLRSLESIPHSGWFSFAGGASVAYVFVRLLPDLSAGQEVVGQAFGSSLGFLEHHVYIVSLVGLITFYGLEKVARTSRRRIEGTARRGGYSMHFWIHIASFGIYNALIGYLVVHRVDPGLFSLLFFSIAIGLHLFVNDFSLWEHHKEGYDRIGRFVLSFAVLFGWAVGFLTYVSDLVIAILTAFIAGGIILNVLKEELPEERKSRFIPFFLGASVITVLLLST
jgi:hypothetical protein